jgi:hypothetical protein
VKSDARQRHTPHAKDRNYPFVSYIKRIHHHFAFVKMAKAKLSYNDDETIDLFLECVCRYNNQGFTLDDFVEQCNVAKPKKRSGNIMNFIARRIWHNYKVEVRHKDKKIYIDNDSANERNLTGRMPSDAKSYAVVTKILNKKVSPRRQILRERNDQVGISHHHTDDEQSTDVDVDDDNDADYDDDYEVNTIKKASKTKQKKIQEKGANFVPVKDTKRKLLEEETDDEDNTTRKADKTKRKKGGKSTSKVQVTDDTTTKSVLPEKDAKRKLSEEETDGEERKASKTKRKKGSANFVPVKDTKRKLLEEETDDEDNTTRQADKTKRKEGGKSTSKVQVTDDTTTKSVLPVKDAKRKLSEEETDNEERKASKTKRKKGGNSTRKVTDDATKKSLLPVKDTKRKLSEEEINVDGGDEVKIVNKASKKKTAEKVQIKDEPTTDERVQGRSVSVNYMSVKDFITFRVPCDAIPVENQRHRSRLKNFLYQNRIYLLTALIPSRDSNVCETYKRFRLQHHPDKNVNNDPEFFKSFRLSFEFVDKHIMKQDELKRRRRWEAYIDMIFEYKIGNISAEEFVRQLLRRCVAVTD